MKKIVIVGLFLLNFIVLVGCTPDESVEVPTKSDEELINNVLNQLDHQEIDVSVEQQNWTEVLTSLDSLSAFDIKIDDSTVYGQVGIYDLKVTVETEEGSYTHTITVEVVDKTSQDEDPLMYETLDEFYRFNQDSLDVEYKENHLPGYYQLLHPGINMMYLYQSEHYYISVHDNFRVVVYDTEGKEGFLLDADVSREGALLYFDDGTYIMQKYDVVSKYDSNHNLIHQIEINTTFVFYDEVEDLYFFPSFIGEESTIVYVNKDLEIVKETNGGMTGLYRLDDKGAAVIINEKDEEDGLYDVFTIVDGKRIYLLRNQEFYIAGGMTKDYHYSMLYGYTDTTTEIVFYDGEEVVNTISIEGQIDNVDYLVDDGDYVSLRTTDDAGLYHYQLYNVNGTKVFEGSFEERINLTSKGYFMTNEFFLEEYNLSHELINRYDFTEYSTNRFYVSSLYMYFPNAVVLRKGNDYFIVNNSDVVLPIDQVSYINWEEEYMYYTAYNEEDDLAIYKLDSNGNISIVENEKYQWFYDQHDTSSPIEYGAEPLINYINETSYVIHYYEEVDGSTHQKYYYYDEQNEFEFDGHAIGFYYSLVMKYHLVDEDGNYIAIPMH
ncbi:MAG: hypothetical protein ACVCEJ_03605 [Candidatus Izemoplasmataceae bacterium]